MFAVFSMADLYGGPVHSVSSQATAEVNTTAKTPTPLLWPQGSRLADGENPVVEFVVVFT